ncbi:GPI mannosyltransferase 2 [Nannizzia gypsea CBS 118893]|uniref:GPI mannosyltransferase 2 n=1 Tax=Arthroderma gypseum (strain ATCC MYA-4604 / CBS 118893) TaxID=535722 RepID=E4V1B7_ARTGP|nr:GPI mannosyltransferase 2 [Nannizzia gypsea CBS 118893]EFR03832.1 GPI mannosyltransferase 2 [Nannizzia gypsea CBS 118893]
MPSSRMTTRAIDRIGTLDRPIYTLTKCFCLWKTVLLLIVLASPGPGYDTSTALLLSPDGGNAGERGAGSSVAWLISHIGHRLARWDSIYFLKLAQRGYFFEQEWAFGYGYTRFLSFLLPESLKSLQNLAVTAALLSNICHYLSVLVLYGLSRATFKGSGKNYNAFPFLASALHIITPAGAFISAPNGEAAFSFLNFSGCYAFITALNDERQGSYNLRDLKFLLAGALFAAATTVRSNGLLSGLLFAYDAVSGLHQILTHGLSWQAIRRLAMVCAGGSLILIGMVGPQYVAYKDFCLSEHPRPWCSRPFPSIYAWVQSYYWNVGFLRYWTFSNIPLLCIAAPMISILVYSGLRVWASLIPMLPGKVEDERADQAPSHSVRYQARLALPQVVLATLAVTHYHIQIVNRISSGYPLWYWFLASRLVAEKRKETPSTPPFWPGSHVVMRVIMLYALIQGCLFASFLPPA